MKLTLIHPAVGKRPAEKYIRAWQMEPLAMATIAALTPKDIDIDFQDDRMEELDYDRPTDLVAITVETYTAKRSYQIASHYRKRNIPVVMGGFHATLCPDEVAEYADTVVIGEAETTWGRILEDFQAGRMQARYQPEQGVVAPKCLPDRSIYKGKDYVKITLLEAGRGCRFVCEFCSIHEFFGKKHHLRPVSDIVEEIKGLEQKGRLLFFVDDNIVSDQQRARELFKALIPLKIKWVGQADILVAKDPELLDLMRRSGCQGVLIGFENLNEDNLILMKKKMNRSVEFMEQAIRTIHSKGIRLYATFLFGYGQDRPEDFNIVRDFCIRNRLFMVGFNHLTPFPGTQLYERLKRDNRLTYDKWWLSDEYTYGDIPFHTELDTRLIENECRRIRREFYSWRSILYRMSNLTNINSYILFPFYFTINFMLGKDTGQRMHFPLGKLPAEALLKTNR